MARRTRRQLHARPRTPSRDAQEGVAVTSHTCPIKRPCTLTNILMYSRKLIYKCMCALIRMHARLVHHASFHQLILSLVKKETSKQLNRSTNSQQNITNALKIHSQTLPSLRMTGHVGILATPCSPVPTLARLIASWKNCCLVYIAHVRAAFSRPVYTTHV